MSSSAPPLSDPNPPDVTLAALRAEIDRLDDALHETLMARASVVGQLGALNAKGRTPFRAGREAAIIRRLLARHRGPLPAQAVPRIWREILAATTAIQGGFALAVCDADADGGFSALAREHFGALTPLRRYPSPAQAIAEVSAATAAVAVLPLPSETDTHAAAWWRALLPRDEPRMHIVARLPFWAPRPDGAPRAQAFVVAAVPPDPSGRDRALLGLELAPEISRARLIALLGAAGFAPGPLILRRDPGSETAEVLAEVEGFVTDHDPRLAQITPLDRPPVVLGAYAAPAGETTP